MAPDTEGGRGGQLCLGKRNDVFGQRSDECGAGRGRALPVTFFFFKWEGKCFCQADRCHMHRCTQVYSYLLWTGSSPSPLGRPGTPDMSWHQGLRNSCSLSEIFVSCPLSNIVLSHSTFSWFCHCPLPMLSLFLFSSSFWSPSITFCASVSVSHTLCFNAPSLIVLIHTAATLGGSSFGPEAEGGGGSREPQPPPYFTHLKSWGLRGGTRIKTTQRRLLFSFLVCSFLRGSPRNVGYLIF